MKRIFLLIGVPILLAALGFAQTPAPSNDADQIAIKGCLSGSDGNYTVAEDNTGRILKLTGSSVDLKTHLGQDVKLVGHKANGAGTSGSAENSLAVTELTMISEHCAAAAAVPAATVSTTSDTVGTPPGAAAAAPAATVSAPSETAPAPPAAAPPNVSAPAEAVTTLPQAAAAPAPAPAATVTTPSEVVPTPPAAAAPNVSAPAGAVAPPTQAATAPVAAPAATAVATPAAAAVVPARPSARTRSLPPTTPAAVAPAEEISTPAATAPPPAATSTTPPAPVSPPPAKSATSVWSGSPGILVSFIVLVLVIGALTPLFSRWRKRKLLEQTSAQNLSFSHKASSDPGTSGKPEVRKAA
jgi:hypothetical protein